MWIFLTKLSKTFGLLVGFKVVRLNNLKLIEMIQSKIMWVWLLLTLQMFINFPLVWGNILLPAADNFRLLTNACNQYMTLDSKFFPDFTRIYLQRRTCHQSILFTCILQQIIQHLAISFGPEASTVPVRLVASTYFATSTQSHAKTQGFDILLADYV